MRGRAVRGIMGDTGGAVAAEFVLVVLPLIVIVFGVIEFGRLMHARNVIQEAAIATARCMGVILPSCAANDVYSAGATLAFAQAKTAALGIVVPADGITLDRAAICSGVGGFSRASLRMTFTTAVPRITDSLAAGIALTGTSCFPNHR